VAAAPRNAVTLWHAYPHQPQFAALGLQGTIAWKEQVAKEWVTQGRAHDSMFLCHALAVVAVGSVACAASAAAVHLIVSLGAAHKELPVLGLEGIAGVRQGLVASSIACAAAAAAAA